MTMRYQLRRCARCKTYTMKASCPRCREDTTSVHPAKFSPDDRYMRYRLAERYQDG